MDRWKRLLKYLFFVVGVVAYGYGLWTFSTYKTKLGDAVYVSERALLPGYASFQFGPKHADHTLKVSREYNKVVFGLSGNETLTPQQRSRQTAEYLAKTLEELGLRAHIQSFVVAPGSTQQGITNTTTSPEIGYNVYAILPSPRGDGTDAIVLSSRYYSNQEEIKGTYTTGVSIVLGLFKFFNAQPWLSKDFIVLFTDGRHGQQAARSWLEAYHSRLEPQQETPEGELEGFARSGHIVAAFCLEANGKGFESVTYHLEGANGQLPNMDLLAASQKIARKIGISQQLPLNYMDAFLPESLNASLTIYEKNLFNMMTTLAIGVPSGDHGAFGVYHVDALTIEAIPGIHAQKKAIQNLSKLLEGVMRSVNSIIERLHQSYYYYLLLDFKTYVPIGYYTPTLLYIVAPVLLRGLYYYFLTEEIGPAERLRQQIQRQQRKSKNQSLVKKEHDNKANTDSSSSTSDTGKQEPLPPVARQWFNSYVSLTVLCCLALVVFLLPFFLETVIPDQQTMLRVWLSLSAFLIFCVMAFVLPYTDSIFIVRPSSSLNSSDLFLRTEGEWASIGCLSGSLLFLFIVPCTFINFSFTVLLAILVTPVYTIVDPVVSTFPSSSSSALSKFSFFFWNAINIFQLLAITCISPVGLVAALAWFFLDCSFMEAVTVILAQFKVHSTLTYPVLVLLLLPSVLLLYKSQVAFLLHNLSRQKSTQ
ncbi:Glycosyl phosphatidyl inositol protein transamidase complex subunit [Balamuthia mandrillaris]